MLAIYKRELKSYLTSMVGYLFMFFVLLIAGIYFSAYQLSAAYPKFEYTLNAMTFVFLIAVPILTMRVLAEERKQKTDQLLCADIDQAVFIRCAGYPSGKYGTSYGCCFRTVLWCTYCDRGHDARCGENSNSLYFQCSGNVGCKNSGDFYLHPSSWTGTCVCLGMHDRSQYASFCFIHFTLFQRQMEPYE